MYICLYSYPTKKCNITSTLDTALIGGCLPLKFKIQIQFFGPLNIAKPTILMTKERAVLYLNIAKKCFLSCSFNAEHLNSCFLGN